VGLALCLYSPQEAAPEGLAAVAVERGDRNRSTSRDKRMKHKYY